MLLMNGLIAARSAAVSDGRNVHHSVGGLTKAGAQNILIWTECRSSCFWVDELIDKLQHLPAFREGDQNNIIARLKKSWTAYQKNTSEVMSKFGKYMESDKDWSGITTWHYRMNFRIDSEVCYADHCRYCASGDRYCD